MQRGFEEKDLGRDISVLSFSNLFVSLDDESGNINYYDDDDDDHVVNGDIPVNHKIVSGVSSFRQLWRSDSNLSSSNLASSVRTARISNVRGENNDCSSPPNFIDGSDTNVNRNTPRSIFGRQAKKKYNVKRVDVDSTLTSSKQHCRAVHPQEEASDDTGLVSLIGVEYSPLLGQTNESSSRTFNPPQPGLQIVGGNVCSHHDRLTPVQAHTGRKLWMNIIFSDPEEDGESCTTTNQNANDSQHPRKSPQGTAAPHHHDQALIRRSNPITDGKGPLLRPIVALALPSAVQSILSNAYGFNSFVFVGHMRDRTRSSIATIALSSVVGVQIVIFAFHNVIPSGANTHVSQNAGAGDRVMAGLCFRSAFYSSVVFSSIVGIVGRMSIVGISEMCNSEDPRVTEAIREYLGIVFLTSPFFSVMLLVDGYFKSIGDASTPFKLELVSLLLNSVLNYVMVVRFDYGIGGSAIAASMGRLVPSVCGLYMILRGENRGISVSLSLLQDLPMGRRPAVGRWAAAPGGRGAVEMAAQWAGTAGDGAGCDGGKLDREVLETYGTVDCVPRDQATCRDDDDDDDEMEYDDEEREDTRDAGPDRTLGSNLRHVLATSSRMARIGVFDSIAACIYGMCFTSLVRICGLLGDKEQAGLGAGLRGVEWLAFCLSEGFLVAAVTSVGQCVGANAHKRAMDVAIVCCSLSAFTAGALGVPFVLFSEEISQALVSDDEGIVRYCAQYVYVMGWVMSLIGFEMACYGCLLGAGRASIACFVNGACNILRIPLTIYCLYSSQPAMEMARMTLWAFGLSGMKNFPQPTGSFYCIGGVIAFTACLKAVIWFGYFSYLWMSGKYFRGASLVERCGAIVSKDYNQLGVEEVRF